MRDKIVGIYLIQINKYNYIGKSIDVIQRRNKHKSNLKLGKHENPIMQNAFNKYKDFKFSILWKGPRFLLKLMEQNYINWFKNNNLMNIKDASDYIVKEEHKNNISKAHKKSKLVQASVRKAKEARVKNGIFLSEKQKEINRSKIPKKKTYANTTNFCFQKGEEVFVGTRYDFCMYTGISFKTVNQVLVHRQSNTYGWHLHAVAINKPG